MTSEATTVHPDEERLLAWIDEPEAVTDGPALRAHLAACAECRRRAESLEAFLAAVGAGPPAPGAAAFAAQRERILAALPDRTEERGVVAVLLGWRAWWVPALAAATLAGLLVTTPGPRDEAAPGAVSEAAPPLPVQAAAQAAADEVFELAGAVAIPAGELPAPAGEAAADPLDPVALETVALETVDETPAFAELAMEFAELSADEQAAVLEELSITTFDL